MRRKLHELLSVVEEIDSPMFSGAVEIFRRFAEREMTRPSTRHEVEMVSGELSVLRVGLDAIGETELANGVEVLRSLASSDLHDELNWDDARRSLHLVALYHRESDRPVELDDDGLGD